MIKRISLIVIMLFACSIGCEVVPFIGPAINAFVAWKDGEANAYFANDGSTAYYAMKRTLSDLEYPITTDESKGVGDYYLVADTNDRFKITIDQVEPYTTRISIRVNFMGDKPYAELIYKKLATQLDIIDYTNYRKRRLHK